MALPTPIFDPGTNNLSDKVKETLKMIFQATQFSKFLNTPGNYRPNPEDPDPWPWPIGPWAINPRIDLGLSNILLGEMLLDAVIKAPGNKAGFSVIDAIKRERIAYDALKELSANLQNAQESVLENIKHLG